MVEQLHAIWKFKDYRGKKFRLRVLDMGDGLGIVFVSSSIYVLLLVVSFFTFYSLLKMFGEYYYTNYTNV